MPLKCGVGWGRLLRVPWTARRSNQSIRKEIYPEYSLEGLVQKLQYFGCLMQRANSLVKTLMLGKIEREEGGNRGRDDWVTSLTQSTWVWASSGRWWRTVKPCVLQFTVSQRVGHYLVTEQPQSCCRWGQCGNSVRFHVLGFQNHCRQLLQPRN